MKLAAAGIFCAVFSASARAEPMPTVADFDLFGILEQYQAKVESAIEENKLPILEDLPYIHVSKERTADPFLRGHFVVPDPEGMNFRECPKDGEVTGPLQRVSLDVMVKAPGQTDCPNGPTGPISLTFAALSGELAGSGLFDTSGAQVGNVVSGIASPKGFEGIIVNVNASADTDYRFIPSNEIFLSKEGLGYNVVLSSNTSIDMFLRSKSYEEFILTNPNWHTMHSVGIEQTKDTPFFYGFDNRM